MSQKRVYAFGGLWNKKYAANSGQKYAAKSMRPIAANIQSKILIYQSKANLDERRITKDQDHCGGTGCTGGTGGSHCGGTDFGSLKSCYGSIALRLIT